MTMGLFDLQSLEWTPAACFIAVQASLTVISAMCFLLGHTDGIYKSERDLKEISSRAYELIFGGCLLGWGLSMVGALIAGGAQVMCILQLIPMLAKTYDQHIHGGKIKVVVNVVLMVADAYFGFAPLPEVKGVEWTSAAILIAVFAVLITFTGVLFVLGKTDQIYDSEPHTKAIMTCRGELVLGIAFLGWGVGICAAIIAGGAPDMCILQLPGMLACTVYHYVGGAKKNVILNLLLAIPVAYFGFVRKCSA